MKDAGLRWRVGVCGGDGDGDDASGIGICRSASGMACELGRGDHDIRRIAVALARKLRAMLLRGDSYAAPSSRSGGEDESRGDAVEDGSDDDIDVDVEDELDDDEEEDDVDDERDDAIEDVMGGEGDERAATRLISGLLALVPALGELINGAIGVDARRGGKALVVTRPAVLRLTFVAATHAYVLN